MGETGASVHRKKFRIRIFALNIFLKKIKLKIKITNKNIQFHAITVIITLNMSEV